MGVAEKLLNVLWFKMDCGLPPILFFAKPYGAGQFGLTCLVGGPPLERVDHVGSSGLFRFQGENAMFLEFFPEFGSPPWISVRLLRCSLLSAPRASAALSPTLVGPSVFPHLVYGAILADRGPVLQMQVTHEMQFLSALGLLATCEC